MKYKVLKSLTDDRGQKRKAGEEITNEDISNTSALEFISENKLKVIEPDNA